MEFMNRGAGQTPFRFNQPANDEKPTEVKADHQDAKTSKAKKSKRAVPKWLTILSGIMVVGIGLLLAALLFLSVFGKEKSETSLVNTSKYQAVFLNTSDGQVYFGKLTDINNKFYKLTDIYYVKVQPTGDEKSTDQNISLAKLGTEIHGPEDMMIINRDQVLFWENLKDDSQVVEAIKDYKANGAQAPIEGQTQTQQQNPSSTDTDSTKTDPQSSTPSTNGNTSNKTQ